MILSTGSVTPYWSRPLNTIKRTDSFAPLNANVQVVNLSMPFGGSKHVLFIPFRACLLLFNKGMLFNMFLGHRGAVVCQKGQQFMNCNQKSNMDKQKLRVEKLTCTVRYIK